MLATPQIAPDLIAAARARMDASLLAWRRLREATPTPPARDARDALESHHFAAALQALDAPFVHRLRAAEGKDGNPLNEVRLLTAALARPDGVLRVEGGIRYHAARSVLGIPDGAPVRLDEASFVRLAEAYLGELARRYAPPTSHAR